MSRAEIRGGLDTSVLLRLLTGEPEPLAAVAREFLAEVEEAGAALYVSNLVIAEAYFACQHHYRMAKSEVLRGLSAVLSLPTFVVPPTTLELLGRNGMETSKPGFLDRVIHSEYAASGLPLISFEKSASRLPGVRVLATPP